MTFLRQLQLRARAHRPFVRLCSSSAREKNGLVLCVYKDGKTYSPTEETKKFDQKLGGQLTKLLEHAGVTGKLGKPRLLYGLSEQYPCIAVVGLGEASGQGTCELEEIHQGRQNIRTAIASGVTSLREVRCSHVTVEAGSHPDASAEGAHLALWSYDELKAEDARKPAVQLSCTEDSELWRRGEGQAAGQNLARTLMEAPANYVTPIGFCERVSAALADLPVEVTVRDEAWIREQKMGAFLSVARGSAEPPRLLELVYNGTGAESAPLAIVGKGVTFDTGGISLKPSKSMDKMRADMGGAACTVGAVYAAARLRLPVNLRAVTPLCENMPGSRATKPGDVVTASNGKTIQVDNTDAEGRLILADALWYARHFQPRAIVDMATLTGAMAVALGSAAVGVFTNSSAAWQHLQAAGVHTGDRVWRMPLWKHYTDAMTECVLADLNNIGAADGGGACTAAAFLQEFVPADTPWLHLDIAGTMENKAEVPYLPKGMSGRPTRTVLEFAERLFGEPHRA